MLPPVPLDSYEAPASGPQGAGGERRRWDVGGERLAVEPDRALVDEPSSLTGGFRETGGDYNLDFHNAPRRQYVINLVGGVEIEVGDGSKRILRAGDVLLAEDTEGQGHISRALNDEPRHSIFVTLD